MEPRLSRWPWAAALPGGLLLLTACSASRDAATVDDEVLPLLQATEQTVLAARDRDCITPVATTTKAAPTSTAVPAPAANAPADLAAPAASTFDLATALATAVQQNREFLARREGLYQQGLATSLTRQRFGPQLAATVAWLWPTGEDQDPLHQASLDAGVTQLLPTGGTLGLTGSLSGSWPYATPGSVDDYGSRVGLSLQQPLLRGAGYEAAHEALTAAERELVYAVRDFELFRQEFSIRIAERFFAVSAQRRTLGNADADYQAAVFDRGKAEALHQLGRKEELEVFLARRREIEAKDQLIDARAAHDRAVDEFKILLGLPTTTAIALADLEPPFEPVRLAAPDAVAAARHNRLDLQTERERVADAERALRIARNGLLPDLSLVANGGLAGQAAHLDGAAPDQWQASVGLQFAVPLQRHEQRANLRLAQIAAEQAHRALTLREDQLDLDIRDALRRLQSLEERVALQQEQIQREERAVTVTKIRYESGKLETRDLLDARQALVDAQNALVRLKLEHFVARLQLWRDLGTFRVDAQGRWR